MKFPKIPYWYLLAGPTLMWTIGHAMNLLVCAANHGAMPVLYPPAIACPALNPRDWIHQCMTSQSHLKILGDWLAMREWNGMYSLGDILEIVGQQITLPGLIAWATCMIKDAQPK